VRVVAAVAALVLSVFKFPLGELVVASGFDEPPIERMIDAEGAGAALYAAPIRVVRHHQQTQLCAPILDANRIHAANVSVPDDRHFRLSSGLDRQRIGIGNGVEHRHLFWTTANEEVHTHAEHVRLSLSDVGNVDLRGNWEIPRDDDITHAPKPQARPVGRLELISSKLDLATNKPTLDTPHASQDKGQQGQGASERRGGVCPEFLPPPLVVFGIAAAMLALGCYIQATARTTARLSVGTAVFVLGVIGWLSLLLGDWWSPLICGLGLRL
jgi:hypothetical protein